MLGLGLGLNRGISLMTNVAQSLWNNYVSRVVSNGGTIYDYVCGLGKLVSNQYIKITSAIFIPAGTKQAIAYSEKPGLLTDMTVARTGQTTYVDSLGSFRTCPDNLVQFTSWTGGGLNIPPSGWSNNFTTGNYSPVGAGTINTNQKIRFYATSGQRYITQTRAVSISGIYTMSVYVDAVTTPIDVRNVLNPLGVTFTVVNYRRDNTIINSSTLIEAGYRYSVTFTVTATGTVSFGIGGGVIAASTYDYTLSRPMVVDGDYRPQYVMVSNRDNFAPITFGNPSGTVSSCSMIRSEPQRNNRIRNNTMVGVTGVGSTGTMPTNWTVSNGGLTRTLQGFGIENGLYYMELSFTGTASVNAVSIFFDSITNWITTSGVAHAGSFFYKTISASSPPLSYQHYYVAYNSSSVLLQEFNPLFTPTTSFARYESTATPTDAATAYFRYGVRFPLNIGSTYNFRFRIYCPQFEDGSSFSTSPIFSYGAQPTRLSQSLLAQDLEFYNLIGFNGGVLYLDLKNTLSFTNAISTGWYLGTNSTGTGDGIRIAVRSSPARPTICKVVSGVVTNLHTLTTDNAKIMCRFDWNTSLMDVFVNGVKVVTGTSFPYASLNYLGCPANNAAPYYLSEWDLGSEPSDWTDSKCITRTTP